MKKTLWRHLSHQHTIQTEENLETSGPRATATATLESIGNTWKAEVMLVACIITGSSLTNTTQVTLGKVV